MRRISQFFFAASPVRSLPTCIPTSASRFQHLQAPANRILSINPNASRTPVRSFAHTSATSSNSPFRLSTKQPTTPPHTDAPEQPQQPQTDPTEALSSKDVYYSPYKPKRTWPPDMTKLSPKHQFRLERKYRRRAALKYARPKWTKATKLAQGAVIGFVIIYALLFMEWDERGASPIEEFRTYIFGSIKDAFSAPPSPASMRRPDGSGKE
ncbi:hypothetical protein BJY01DRAFT_96670 [Aspergillus pseudoustus]|uniref:Uncharacterized protein n=1 Tax=Aspergillus pseudoustus TaxID=1810923 RepID=A0ABR4KJL4_9EURO